MYRPEITVVDCTIRDGGLLNNSRFPLETVKGVYDLLCDAGIHVIELGYKNSKEIFSTDEFGPWRFCDEKDLRKVVTKKQESPLTAVMMDAHKSEPDSLLPAKESVIDMVRVATYAKDIDKAINLANTAYKKGYRVTLNIMAISHTIEWELEEALKQISRETDIKACYIVDSFGALYSEDIDYYFQKYRSLLKEDIEIGIHCHNNQQLAFANTIEGIIKGINYLDGTLLGMGRGAGNCPLELLVNFLKNPKFDIAPVYEAISKYITPYQKEIDWGYHIPYMIAGVLNLRPDEPIKIMNLPKDDAKRYDYRGFYKKLLKDV